MVIVVVGGGCSGVCCAINAVNGRDKIILLERNDMVLKKLLMTGNGRCNYFNDDQDLRHYHSYSNLIDKFITDKNLELVRVFFDNLGIIPKIKNGYYYPSTNQATTIRDVFVQKLLEGGVDVRCNYFVDDIDICGDGYLINNDIYCDKLVIATGSFAYPKSGSDGCGYTLLEKLGVRCSPILPSLVQLESSMKYCKDLDGVRVDAIVSLYENGKLIREEAGEVQLTSYGISGICTFNLSYYVGIGLYNKEKEVILVNFVPFIEGDYFEWFDKYSKKIGRVTVYELLNRIINKKISDVVLKRLGISRDIFYDDLGFDEKKCLINMLTSFEYPITGTKGFDNGQVCSGGVLLEEINPFNFSCLAKSNLHVLGELIDITGDCGGYNLTLCWISGILAGRDLGGYND